MSGGAAGIIALAIIFVILTILIFVYGSFHAYKGSKSKPAIGLLAGTLIISLGFVLYIVALMFDYNSKNVVSKLCLISLSFGMLLMAVSFVLYVREHNKLLQRALLANPKRT